MSVSRSAPAGDDAVLVTQCNVPVRIFARRRVIGRVTDAGIGGGRDLLNRGSGLVPDFEFIRKILAAGRSGPLRRAPWHAVFAIAGRPEP